MGILATILIGALARVFTGFLMLAQHVFVPELREESEAADVEKGNRKRNSFPRELWMTSKALYNMFVFLGLACRGRGYKSEDTGRVRGKTKADKIRKRKISWKDEVEAKEGAGNGMEDEEAERVFHDSKDVE